MEELWNKACHHYDVPEDVTKAWYARIREQLSSTEPQRFYHNWDEMMVRKYEHLQHCKPNIILAAFFQYYKFDGKCNCVKESCAAFEDFCRDAMLEDPESKCLILRLLGDKTSEGELAATSHEDDGNILQDLDLVILAAAPDDYKRYTQLLRRDYANMTDESYKMMRLKVLNTLLTIPNIYSTEEFQTKFEKAARSNIKNEIIELKQ